MITLRLYRNSQKPLVIISANDEEITGILWSFVEKYELQMVNKGKYKNKETGTILMIEDDEQ